MKNYFLVFILIPFLVFPQKTEYSYEQEKYVEKVVDEITSQKEINFEAFIETLNNALKKAPYHPDLVYQLLRIYTYGLKDLNFVANYCQQLDKDYLINNQDILVQFCANCYFYTDDNNKLLNMIQLIKEQKDKDLYYALFYIETNDIQKAFEYTINCIDFQYQNQSQYYSKRFLINRMIMDLYRFEQYSHLSKIVTNYKDQLKTIELSIEAYLLLIEAAILNENYASAQDLISNSIIRFPQFFKYMSVYKALIYSKKSEDLNAIKAMEKALSFDDSAFNVILNEKDGLNIFSNYILTLNNLSNYDDKVLISQQMLEFFQGKELFSLKVKLYQSVLYASRDKEKAYAILNSCQGDITEKKHQIFEDLINIQFELNKENPDYKSVAKMLHNFKNLISDKMFLMLMVDFKYTVNIGKNSAYFEAKKMVEELDQLIDITDDEEQKLKFTLQKIQTIATYDVEKANLELEKLGIAENERLYYLDQEFKNKNTIQGQENTRELNGIEKFYNLNSLFIDFVMTVERID